MKAAGQFRIKILGSRAVPYYFLLPSLILLTIFWVIPIFCSFGLSFSKWHGIGPIKFAGLSNYLKLLGADEFWIALRNTLIFAFVTVPLGLVLALSSALLLNQQIKGRAFFRGIIFFPVIISMIVIALIWTWMFNPHYGVVNNFMIQAGLYDSIFDFLMRLGLFKYTAKSIGWLTQPTLAFSIIMIMSVWKGFGYGMVIYLAGLQNIPDMYYEAAKIDGASAWQRFWHVTLPLLNPTTFFVLVIAFIGSFQVFDQVYVMTHGGPGYSTTVMVHYIYTEAFKRFHMGLACSIAYMLFIIIFLLTLIQIKFFSARMYEL